MASATATQVNPKLYEQLKQVRASKTLELKPTPMLRTEIEGFDGAPQTFKLRYYQSQGIYHLLICPRMVLGDGTGLGKTVQVIGALCYLWDKEPATKAIVVCTKSSIRQWASEVYRFTEGVKVFIASGTAAERKAAYDAWVKAPTGKEDPKVILVMNYHTLVRDWTQGSVEIPPSSPSKKPTQSPGLLDRLTASIPKIVTVFDECTAFKNPSTKTHQVAKFLSDRSVRCYGLTATLLKNNLLEGFGIYKVIKPGVFTSKVKFEDTFCIKEMKWVKGGAQIPVVVGYKNLELFRATIDPFFYGRPKHLVSDELPNLTTREVLCELSPAEDKKYQEALAGILELGDGDVKEYTETKDLTSLIYCQQVVDSLALLRYEGGEDVERTTVADKSAKEEALLDLLTDEFEGEKVIVYTRFEKLVGRLQKLLEAAKIKSVRVTGKESDQQRQNAMKAFQDFKSGVPVIFITNAGSDSINLQAASAMVFFDTPWVWGDYAQLLGRMIRIGSPHPNVLAIHLMAERPYGAAKKRETIDHKTVAKLRKKKGLIDQIIGEAAKGALMFERGEDNFRDILEALRSDARVV